MKKLTALLLTGALASSVLAGCSGQKPAEEATASQTPATTSEAQPAEQQELNIAIFQGGYGRDYWDAVAAEFEKENPGVKVNIEANPEIGEIIRPKILSGNAPDFIYLPSTNNSGIATALIKDKGLADITDVFTDEIKAKMLPGFLESSAMQPYGDGKIYLAPLYYSATGLFYNQDFFDKNNLKAPTTWDEFFALGEKGKELGRPLLTYQGIHPGYMEAFLIPAMVSAAGNENFAKATNYEDGAWEQEGIKKAMNKVAEIASKGYLMDGTVALDHTQAQSQWLLGKAMFIPCGGWLEGEMKDAPREEGFKWGFTAAPAFNVNDDKYALAAVEEMYIPASAKNMDMAKKFLAYQYSDKAIALNAEKAKGIPPVKGAADILKPYVEDATYATYTVFENGYMPAIARFASVEDSEVRPDKAMYEQLTAVMSGEMTGDAWSAYMEKLADSVRDKVVK
ncbi:MAG: carbohydrate ABC transporter substrate-binding protein [Cellulosilyticaceae bacterium]